MVSVNIHDLLNTLNMFTVFSPEMNMCVCVCVQFISGLKTVTCLRIQHTNPQMLLMWSVSGYYHINYYINYYEEVTQSHVLIISIGHDLFDVDQEVCRSQ